MLAVVVWAAPHARAQTTWTTVTSHTQNDLWGVCHGGGQFVAVGVGGTILTSTDGSAWAARDGGTSEWLLAVTYGGGQYVAVGNNGAILTSPDAATWTRRDSGTNLRLNGVAFGGDRYLAVGEQGIVSTSADGVTWSAAASGAPSFLRAVAYRADVGFVLGGGNQTILVTTDGVHFKRRGILTHGNVEALFCDGTTFFAAGESELTATATDPRHWTVAYPWISPSDWYAYFRGITRFNDTTICVGQSGRGNPLEPIFCRGYVVKVDNPAARLAAVAASANEVVAVGFEGVILRSVPPQTSPGVIDVTVSGPGLYVGNRVTLSAWSSNGATPKTYQWLRSGVAIAGATASTLTLGPLSPADVGVEYQCKVSNAYGSTTGPNSGLPLSVRPAPTPGDLIDPTFSTPIVTEPRRVDILPDGRLLVRAEMYFYPGDEPQEGIARLNVDGSLDETFNLVAAGLRLATGTTPRVLPNGDVLISTVSTLAPSGNAGTPAYTLVKSDGTIVPLGTRLPGNIWLTDGRSLNVTLNGNVVTISRNQPDGSPDAGFPTQTIVLAEPHVGSWDPDYRSFVFAHDDLGRVFLAASTYQSTGGTGAIGVRGSKLIRLLPDGLVDASFPVRTLSLPIEQLVIVAGKIHYVSFVNEIWGEYDIYAGRLTASALEDPGYSRVSFHGGSMTSSPRNIDMVLNPDGSLVVASVSGLARYDPDGVRDTDFLARFDLAYPVTLRLHLLPDGRPLLAGSFTAINGRAVTGLARIKPVTSGGASRLANMSIRATAGEGDRTLIAGFVIGGASGSRSMLTRAVGPGLEALGLGAGEVLADPKMLLFRPAGTTEQNDDWDESIADEASRRGAFPLTPGSKDAALRVDLGPGSYGVHVNTAGAAPGIALLEIYDDTKPSEKGAPRLVNSSGRAYVGPGQVLIAGFVVSGDRYKRLLIRGIGPRLSALGVSGPLANPRLEVYRGGTIIAENDDWGTSKEAWDAHFKATGAFSLEPGSKDAALVVDLAPGVYTAMVRGVEDAAGLALVEVYELPYQ
ncbi:hypothetical protein [Opitutus sp. ER46]|uniref:hypothetical protein n=1 Tax=Opitutus sp. ER46 TaxID=2161864 RepID=UPI001304B81D|nr:hypothetical protein [Opitutus sp. ER46]